MSGFVKRLGVVALGVGLVFAGVSGAVAQTTLLNVSYDPTRELYKDFNAAFAKHWKAETGEDVTHKKPAPDIFLEAARRLGLDPTLCLVIEDAVSGVTAAKSAGSRCLGLTTSFSVEQLAAAGVDWTAATLAEAPEDVLS